MTDFTQLDRKTLLDVDFLRKSGAKPDWFGLGFIQMKFDLTSRMHFWHPALAADVGEEELHDHRYDFRSRVLHGTTTHEVYDFVSDAAGDLGLFHVSCKKGDESEPAFQVAGRVEAAGSYTMVAGSEYTFPHRQFHRIRATECITLVHRAPVVKEFASVVKPIGAAHVCPFHREIGEDELWHYIEELVTDSVAAPGAGYHLKPIHKGVLGEVSKIEEEFLEFKDSLKQDNPAMAFIELADQLGAIEAWLERHHPSITMKHLVNMKDANRRAFENGHRT
jgi:hypothetical protein